MAFKIAINGFGRIGRMFLRVFLEKKVPGLSIVAINDPMGTETAAYLFEHDSTNGPYPTKLSFDHENLRINDTTIRFFSTSKIQTLDWEKLDVDLVIESSGKYKNNKDASLHLRRGAKKVVISTIADGADRTIVYGVNHNSIRNGDRLISNASCTSNCLLSVLFPLYKAFGIESAHMTSVHAYTSDQNIVDAPHTELRRCRATNNSIIPSSTNAVKAVSSILPDLADSIKCTALRVPVSNVSAIDLIFYAKKTIAVPDVLSCLKEAENSTLKGVLAVTNKPLVSVDYLGNPHSAVVDAPEVSVTNGKWGRILAWYDNEWGYASRLHDLSVYLQRMSSAREL